MESRKISAFSLLPTAILFGLGIGNLWGIAGLFSRLGTPDWLWLLHLACLAVLTAFLCGVAQIWWTRGAAIPLFAIVAAAWVFSAPVAAITGRFTPSSWAVWLLVLVGCASVALLAAWLLERGKRNDAE
jgi:hypothetical protein